MPTTITPDPLTTLANVKATVGLALSDTTEDALLNLVIPQVSAAITTNCNRTHFLSSNAANPITEFYSGDGTQFLFLRQYPVQSVANIWEDDNGCFGQSPNAFASDTQLVAGSDFVLKIDGADGTGRAGIVYRINDVWGTQFVVEPGMLSASLAPFGGMGNIKVQYTVGYSSLPPDLELATIRIISRIRASAQYGRALQSEGYEEYSYSLQSDPTLTASLFAGDIAPVLARYRIAPIPVTL